MTDEKELKIPKCNNFCYTLNNYTESELQNIISWAEKNKKHDYNIFSQEVGEEKKTPHLQGYVHFTSARKILPKKLFRRAHAEQCRGDLQSNLNYVMKSIDGWPFDVRGLSGGPGWFAFGELPMDNGKKRNLQVAIDDIEAGGRARKYVRVDFSLYNQYGRSLEVLEAEVQRTNKRKWLTKGVWYWGPTGSGKSTLARNGLEENSYYVWKKKDLGWQDGYIGQETIIIEEFRHGTIDYDELLEMVDRFEYTIRRRGREPTPLLAKTIIITSPMHPADIFQRGGGNIDSIDQLLRRFDIYQLHARIAEEEKED